MNKLPGICDNVYIIITVCQVSTFQIYDYVAMSASDHA